MNARRCGRLHCYFTGPVFVLAAIYVALAAANVVPNRPGAFLLTVVAVSILACLAELPLGRYKAGLELEKKLGARGVRSYLSVCGTSKSLAVEGKLGTNQRNSSVAAIPPANWAVTNSGTSMGLMPANVSLRAPEPPKEPENVASNSFISTQFCVQLRPKSRFLLVNFGEESQ